MALTIGNKNATSGMSKSIYDEIRDAIEPDLGDLDEPTLEDMRDGWRKLAFAIATGVIEHIQSNMEIQGVQTRGNIAATVSGSSATQNNVTFTQNNNGTGLVG